MATTTKKAPAKKAPVKKTTTTTKKAPAKKVADKKVEETKVEETKVEETTAAKTDLDAWYEDVGQTLIRKGVSNRKFVAMALQAAGKGDKANELQELIEEAGINRSSGASPAVIDLIKSL